MNPPKTGLNSNVGANLVFALMFLLERFSLPKIKKGEYKIRPYG
jgi:hypothetical protein